MSGMKKISIIWGCLLVLIVGGLTTLGIIWKNNNKPYKDAEEKIKLLAQSYKDATTIPEGGKVTLAELKEAKLIEELKVNEEVCDGYVKIEKTNTVYKYTGFIKCENYKTTGY